MNLFIHFEATRGAEPYLLLLEAQAGPSYFKALLRPPVTVQPPKGYSEAELARHGLQARMVIPWLAQIAKTTKTVIVFDAPRFMRVMDCEMQRLGKSEWIRPAIEIIDLSEKATPIVRIETENGFRKPSFEEASLLILNQNAKGLETVKALHAHKEIKELLEVA